VYGADDAKVGDIGDVILTGDKKVDTILRQGHLCSKSRQTAHHHQQMTIAKCALVPSRERGRFGSDV